MKKIFSQRRESQSGKNLKWARTFCSLVMGVRYEPSMRKGVAAKRGRETHGAPTKRHVISPSYDIGTAL
ncbi:MAG: hypothetical protein ACLP29_13280, partial [Dissulfurispiraceae bacterium]